MKLLRTGCLLLIATAIFLGHLPAQAQPSAILRVPGGGIGGPPGASVTAQVLLTHVGGSYDGFSFGLSYVPSVVTLNDVHAGAALDPLLGGIDPAFYILQTLSTGSTAGCLVSLDPSQSVPPAVDAEILVLSFAISPTAPPGSYPLNFVDTLGDPPVDLTVVVGAAEIPVTAIGGAVQVVTASFAMDAGSTGVRGGIAPVSIRMTHAGVGYDGFSFGLSHDEAVLTPQSLAPGDALDPLAGGFDPLFFIAQPVPGGITVGCLVSLDPSITVPPAAGEQILEATYLVSPTAPEGPTSLSFSAGLGSPPVDLSVVLDAIDITPQTTGGTIDVLPSYLRGDVNQSGSINLVDAVTLLQRIFGMQPQGTCREADDANDTETVTLTDVVYLINFLFQPGSPPPPAPYPLCGTDPTEPHTLGCAAFNTCP